MANMGSFKSHKSFQAHVRPTKSTEGLQTPYLTFTWCNIHDLQSLVD